MHIIQVLTDKARGTKYIYLKKKESSEYQEEPGINFFFLFTWNGVGWTAVRVREVWGQEMVRREEISEKLTLLVSFYIKMQMAFYLNLVLCFSQCL